MLHLLGLSGLVLVHLAFPAHGALVKRSAYQCNSSIANTYCRNHIESSRNPSGNCIDGVIMCYMTSPICRNAADCVAACRPLSHKGIYVGAQCIGNQCRCKVADQCTQASCDERCMIQYKGKIVQSSKCLTNNSCICSYYDPCTSGAGCRSVCEQNYPGKKITWAHCRSDRTCLCQYQDQCTEAWCKERCMIQHKGKVVHYSKCLPNNQCICTYSDRGTGRAIRPGTRTAIPPGTGTAIRPSVLTIAIILLSTLAPIPAPAEGKFGALLIPSAIFVFSTSELAFG